MAFDRDVLIEAAAVLELCRERGLRLATAESCTGGLVAAALTAIAGSSDVVQSAIVAYSDEAKVRLLGISDHLLQENGAVSEPVARAMAEATVERLSVDIAASVTGIAGPGGGSAAKPVGLVHFACARLGRPTLHLRRLYGERGRSEIRRLSVLDALRLMRDQVADAVSR